MTEAEFLDLKDHARIKYVGANPEALFGITHMESWSGRCKTLGGSKACAEFCITTTMPKSFLTKGIVVSYVCRDTYSGGKKYGQLELSYYGGNLSGINPADWILVDARKWVEGESEYKRAKSYIPQVARKFKQETKQFLTEYKRRVEYKLDNLPLDKKLKLIMELSPEDKKWFGILSATPDDVITLIEKAFENEEI